MNADEFKAIAYDSVGAMNSTTKTRPGSRASSRSTSPSGRSRTAYEMWVEEKRRLMTSPAGYERL